MKIPIAPVLIAALALAPITLAFAQDRKTNAALPANTSLDLFLLVGQSNMAGRGKLEDQDKIAPPRVWTFNRNQKWAPATDPLHFDKDSAAVGPGRTFGRTVSDALPKIQVGLIPCAVGGTSIARWKKGGELYNNAVARARKAMKHGTLKAILWHQGESDLGKSDIPRYQESLRRLIADFRADLNAPGVPFIIGEIGCFYQRRDSEGIDAFNEGLRAFASTERNCACVGSEGLTPLRDNLHFNAKSARELGRRYAAAYLKLTDASAPARLP